MIQTVRLQEETTLITNFLKRIAQVTKFNKVIIALSGGLDSSVVAFLAVKALGKDNILVAKLPYNNQDNDADLVIGQLEIPEKNIFEIDIKPIVDLLWETVSLRGRSGVIPDRRSNPCLPAGRSQRDCHADARNDQIRLGNIMARVRMTIIYDLAKANNCLVCGTENKSEFLLGYFTLFGDSASDLEPIRHLYKTQVRELAKYLKVPKHLIDKPPTANLWPGQTDENELGFNYSEADQILSLYFDQKLTIEKIINQGFNKKLVEKVISQINKNSFKVELPYQLK